MIIIFLLYLIFINFYFKKNLKFLKLWKIHLPSKSKSKKILKNNYFLKFFL